MVNSRTKLIDRVLAAALAVFMVLAMIPATTFTAVAASVQAGDDCQEAECGGKLQWLEAGDAHYLVCDNGECAYSAAEEAYLTHEAGNGDEDCPVCNPPHVHGAFEYSVKDQTIVATCGAEGSCDLKDKQVSITIAAPTGLEYDGTVKAATISGAKEWEEVTGTAAPAITYSAEPKTVGTYTASMTVAENTASVEFTIVKGAPAYTVPADLVATYGQTLADVKLPAGFAWEDAAASVGEPGVQSFEATYTPADTDNYNIVNDVVIEITVEKASGSIAAPVAKETTQTSITLEEVVPAVGDGTVMYGYAESKDTNPAEITNWQAETTFEGLNGSTTYYFYARVEATEYYEAAVSAAASIATQEKLNGKAEISLEGWTYGEAANEPEFAVDVAEYSVYRIEYAKKGENNWSEAVPTQAGQYTVRVVYEATAVYAEAMAACDFEIAKKEVTLVWAYTELTYNGKEQVPAATAQEGNILDADLDDIRVIVHGDQVDAGAYEAEAVLNGEGADNYVILNNTVQFTIKTKEVSLTWSNTELFSNRQNQKPTAAISSEIYDEIGVEVSGAAKDVATHTATAVLTGDAAKNYHIAEAQAQVEFTISYIATPKEPYSMDKANDNLWHKKTVTITAAEGYTIGTEGSLDVEFVTELTVDKTTEVFTVYLKDENGYYTDAIEIKDIFIDKDSPTAAIKLNEEVWEVFAETVTFGNYQKEEVTFTIEAKDKNSGIEKIYYYKLEKDRLEEEDLLKEDDLEGISWTEGSKVIVNTDSDYVIYAKVVDYAGNVTYISTKKAFVYDATPPVIEVSFDNNDVANETYFKADRTATIKITEHNFKGAVLTVTENGEDTSKNYPLEWKSEGDVHTAEVLFENEANYTFSISCTDNADNKNVGVDYGESKAPEAFTIDKSRPNAALVITGQLKDAEKCWAKSWITKDGDDQMANVLMDINFSELWTNANAGVSANATDNLSGVDYIEYIKTADVVTDLVNAQWTKLEKADAFQFEVAPNEMFIIYVHVVDKAGNDIYLSSNGVIVDDKEPGGDNYSPDIDITLPKANNNGIYNDDDIVEVTFKVVDPKYSGSDTENTDGVYSGIRQVVCVIEAADHILDNGEVAKEEIDFDLSTEGTKTGEYGLIHTWTHSIEIDKEKFNSNNVTVTITAIDNAGNKHSTVKKDIKIDVTAPTITVSLDGEADSQKYFNGSRTANIVVTERNFNAEDFSFVFMKDGKPVEVKGAELTWSEENADVGNGDETKNSATYTFKDDADYLLGNTNEVKGNNGQIEAPYFLYTDLADNSYYSTDADGNATTVNFNGDAPMDFTIDTKAPVVTVSYDNNSAENEKYFKAHRTVTITIVEHNFPKQDIKRVEFAQTAERGGEIPEVTWNHEGDTHVATFVYDKDGDYTFDVTMRDLAGNRSEPVDYSASVAANDFVIDTTYEDMISQTGVESGKAYGYDAKVIPSIEIFDINLHEYKVTLTGIQKDKTIDLTEEVNALLDGDEETIAGVLDVFKVNQDLDGIYTLMMTSKDKAGNEDSMEIVFTVNRFGSVYVFEDYLLNLVKDGGAFVQQIDGDLIITEYNADKLVADSLKIDITLDGKPLENVIYSVTPEINDSVSVGSSGWYQYKYTISKDNFAVDGVYKISVASEDATGNTPENSNYEDKGITFRVDSTKADISSITGLEKAIVNAQEVTVKYTVFDTIGIKNIKVYVDGKTVADITDFSADHNNYSGSFTLTERNAAQAVRIVIEDMAGNITDTDAEDFAPIYEFNSSVTVSTNIFVRWYANKGLFWGSVGGAAVAAGALWYFLDSKKKKKAGATA